MLILGIIVILPLFIMVFRTLLTPGGLEAFLELFHTKRPWRLFLRSLILSVSAGVAAVVAGLFTAFFIELSDSRAARICSVLSWFPLLIPPYLHAIAWITVLGGGLFRPTDMKDVSTLSGNFFSIYGLGGVIFVMTLAFYPVATEIIRAGLRSINSSLWESALLQQSPFKVLRHIVLALLKPFLFGAGLIIFILSLGEYGVPSLLSVNTYPVEIFSRFSAFYDEQAAVNASLPLTFTGVAAVVFLYLLMKNRSYFTFQRNPGSLKRLPSPLPRAVLGIVAFALTGAGAVVPLISLIAEAAQSSDLIAGINAARKALVYTFQVSLPASVFIVILALFTGYTLSFAQGFRLNALKLMSVLPLAFPGTAFGIGLIYAWNNPVTNPVYASSFILLILYAGRFFPFVFLILSAAFRQINRHLLDAAHLHSPSAFTRIRKIVVPLTRRGIVTAFITAWILCFRELSGTLLVIPPGNETVSIRIYSLMHYGASEMVSMLGIVQMLVMLLPIAAAMLFLRFSQLKT